MNSLKVLDVTLRDGGCVNDFNFGQPYMDSILNALEQSNVEMIELGYLDDTKGSEQGRTQYINEKVITQFFLKEKKPGIFYVAMMDYGKFNPDKLMPNDGKGIDGIRVAFHKKNCKDIIEVGQKIMEKGYAFFVQPMITLRYSDSELIELIESVNQYLPNASGFYIVDSFGEMRPNDMERILNLVDHNLIPTMTLGFHSHNNLQMSYSNAITLLNFPTNRNLMLDCSIMGMGKGAGNLNTELLMEHLNLFYGKQYKTEPLLAVCDSVLNQIKAEHYWGYSVEYYLSAINHCTPSYASHFYNKHMLPIEQVAELLGIIREDKKISFDRNYAEELYFQYNTQKNADDVEVIQKLNNLFAGKRIVLIAPGKTISESVEKIRTEMEQPNTISIALNNMELFYTDYVFVTRVDVLSKAISEGRNVITTSKLLQKKIPGVSIIDYKKWILVDGEVQDSSGIMAINLLKSCDVGEILLAGFDGFHVNLKKNYYDKKMGHPLTPEQAEKRNHYFKEYVKKVGKQLPLRFLTDSLYEEK